MTSDSLQREPAKSRASASRSAFSSAGTRPADAIHPGIRDSNGPP